jgi:hypothetical protein
MVDPVFETIPLNFFFTRTLSDQNLTPWHDLVRHISYIYLNDRRDGFGGTLLTMVFSMCSQCI